MGGVFRKKSKTMVHEVFRQQVHALPNFVVQEDYTKDRKKSDQMWGKAKADVSEGDVECSYLVEFSVYATKPVNFLSIAYEKLVWNINEKDIYNKATKKKVKLQFYRTEMKCLNN